MGMEESEQRIRKELRNYMRKWNDELSVEGYDFRGSTQILARALLWGAAHAATCGIQAVRPGMTIERLEIEGPTQEEKDAFNSKVQEILDRLWLLVRDELIEHWSVEEG